MEHLKIYRKRMIPDECILLKDDIILEKTDDIIVTKWNTLKPRRDFSSWLLMLFLKAWLQSEQILPRGQLSLVLVL